ncbi:MAG: hypothetical protein EAZ08_01680 [Cytophagales bacterium]|nr:MAG: hypothetical protein EAZ08_01680 [Cytophagales bacterium]
MLPKNFIPSLFSITIFVLLVFGVLRYMQVPAGTLIDWVVGIAIFWWLMIIVTLPWNMHFAAKEVLVQAKQSQDKNINVNPDDIAFAQKLSTRFLRVAIASHLLSALVLVLLSYFGITDLGYITAAAALLLTVLRPAIRMHEYVAERLNLITQEMKYPREDIAELRAKFYEWESRLNNAEYQLNSSERDSYAATQARISSSLEKEIQELKSKLEKLRVKNESEHDQLERKSENVIAKLSEDAQFLNQVREIIKFFKQA